MTSKQRAPLTIRDNFAFFWSQWPSNWEPSPFVINGIEYSCVEQYMMAEKARLFNDQETLNKIMVTKDPAKQKAFGRKVKNYNEDEWDKVRYNVVLRATVEKYRQNEALKQLLMDTGDLILVEASPYDSIWGIGLGVNDPNLMDQNNWGQNLLGKCIVEARNILRFQDKVWNAIANHNMDEQDIAMVKSSIIDLYHKGFTVEHAIDWCMALNEVNPELSEEIGLKIINNLQQIYKM